MTEFDPSRVRWNFDRAPIPAPSPEPGEEPGPEPGPEPGRAPSSGPSAGARAGRVEPSALQPWTAPAPAELPRLRERLIAFTGSGPFLTETRGALNSGQFALMPTVDGTGDHSPGAIGAQLLSRLEVARLTEARLFHVSADMTALACAVAAKPPTEPVRRDRLPSPAGFMVFESPIGGYTTDLTMQLRAARGLQPVHDELLVTVPIVAVSWSHWDTAAISVDDVPGAPDRPVRWWARGPAGVGPVPPGTGGVWVTFYAFSDGAQWKAFDPAMPVARSIPDGTVITAGNLADRQSINSIRKTSLNLAWDNEGILPWGQPFPDAEPDTIGQWGSVVYTAWQLITQKSGKRPPAEVTELPRNRAGRKQDARHGVTDGAVRVVDVHAALKPSEADRGADEAASSGRRSPVYTCRWPVPPYRRNSCLHPRKHEAGECEHEDQIIGFSIRGPAGAPLKVGKTVHVWREQPGDTHPPATQH